MFKNNKQLRREILQSLKKKIQNADEFTREKLEKAVVTTRKRLETATGKLEAAKKEGSELVDALQTGVDKTRAKLEAAEKALHEYQQANSEAAQVDMWS